MLRAAAVGMLTASIVCLLLEMHYDFGGNKGARVGLLCMGLGASVLVLVHKKKTPAG
jgi:hypothetical protein